MRERGSQSPPRSRLSRLPLAATPSASSAFRADPATGCRGLGWRSPSDSCNWRVRRAGPGPGETGMMRSVARQACVRIPGTGRGRGPIRGEPAPVTRCEQSPPARPRRAMPLPPGRAGVSRARTGADGSKRGFGPERSRGSPVFRKQVSQGDRGVDVDHRSFRSPSSSLSNTESTASGAPPRGGSDPGESAGVNQPFRTASASMASARMGLLDSRGGPISATTRPRSVTRTVSPPAASRTYSLSLLFDALIPTGGCPP